MGGVDDAGPDPRPAGSDRADVGGLLALRAIDDVELDRLALGERLVALAFDRGEVDEHVVPALPGDEAEALLVAEPLHGALLCQHGLLCLNTRSLARAFWGAQRSARAYQSGSRGRP